jgi:DNA-binding NarL/FixJ family response regulator
VISILLADDHQILREGLRRSFEAAGENVIGEACDGEDAVRLARQLRPDVVVMDLSMPVCDGVEATRQIVAEMPDTRVVMLTMHDDIERTRQAIAAGAVGYLSKGCAFGDVLETVRMAASGETSLSPAFALEMLTLVKGHLAPLGDDEPLSERQVEILQRIADGLTTKQVARDLGISQKTVHNHLNAIYRRLDTQNLTHAILSAVRQGIIQLG